MHRFSSWFSRPRVSSGLAAVAVAASLCGAGCRKDAQCTAEIVDGTASYKGVAHGAKGQQKLDRDAVRDACRQKCAASKAEMPDPCATRCAADVDAAKLGARINCTDR